MNLGTTHQANSTRWLIAILLGGGLLRVFGIWFGLPYPFARPDEDVATGKALEMLVTGDPNPHFFHWPSLTFYLFAAVYALAGFIFGGPQELVLNLQAHLLLGRAVVALCGTATLFVIFRIGLRLSDASTGLIAAALLAVATLHVRESHFAMTDVPMTLFVSLSLLWLLRAIDEPVDRKAGRWFAAAGVAGGLAASTKYSGIAVIAALLPVFVARTSHTFLSRRAWLPVLCFVGCLALTFAVTSPYTILDAGNFAEGLLFTFSHLAAGQNVNVGRGWTYHLTHSLPFGVGPTAFAAAIAGAIGMMRQNRLHTTVLAAFCAFFFLSIGSGYLVFFRYVLPLVPVVCLAAAVGVGMGTRWLVEQTRLSGRAATVLVLTIVAGPGIVNSLWLDVLLARTDSRVLAAGWLESHLRAGDTFYDSGGKYVAVDLAPGKYRRVTFDAEASAFGAMGDQNPDWLVLHDSPLHRYTDVPRPILVLAVRAYRHVHRIDGTPARPGSGIYDMQDLFFLPIWGMWALQRPGPTIDIYERSEKGESRWLDQFAISN